MTSSVAYTATDRIPQLRLGEVHVWEAPAAETLPVLDRLAGLLDRTEQDRAASFKHSRDRDRYIAAHGVLRRLLGSYLRQHPRTVRFRTASGGKPGLRGARRLSGIAFNLSHDGDLALVGVARFARVGIDVQALATPVQADALARSALSRVERAGLDRLDDRDAVLRLWARKEAVVKATGTGLASRLDQVDVGGRSPVIHDLDVGPHYAAAVASSPWCRRVVQRIWTSSG